MGDGLIRGILIAACIAITVIEWIDTNWRWQERYEAWQKRHPTMFQDSDCHKYHWMAVHDRLCNL